MSNMKKFWLCVLIMYIFGASVCTCFEYSELTPWGKPKYEVKSDIINFDYTKLSYPSQSISVGISTDSDSSLKERKPGRELTRAEKIKMLAREFVGGIEKLLVFFLMFVGCLAWFCLVPYYIMTFVFNVKRAIEEKREEKENPFQ